jgi:hypothetical protein
MSQFKISYQHREADFGQAKRIWSSNYQIVDASSEDDAKSIFEQDWSSSNEFEIKEISKCGAQ